VLAGLLCGVSVFFIALPLAQSSPFPTPRDGGWIAEDASLAKGDRIAAPASHQVAAASSYQLAATSSHPAASPLSLPDQIGTQAAVEWEAMTRSSGLIELPVRQAAREEAEPTGALPASAKPAEAKTAALTSAAPGEPPAKRALSPQEEVDDYLWQVYQRSPVKKDGSGEFTWKDPAAAKRKNMALKEYVIGGMSKDFREQLYHAGKAMDEAGLNWTMLSAFRDDYRQSIAAGIKARTCGSLHGGSCVTGGYGDGRAADVVNADGDHNAVWRWIDRNAAKYGLARPMPGYDPAHIQPGGNWHNVAMALRAKRTNTTEVASAQPAEPVNARGRRARYAHAR
jgi:hypothetical protein